MFFTRSADRASRRRVSLIDLTTPTQLFVVNPHYVMKSWIGSELLRNKMQPLKVLVKAACLKYETSWRVCAWSKNCTNRGSHKRSICVLPRGEFGEPPQKPHQVLHLVQAPFFLEPRSLTFKHNGTVFSSWTKLKSKVRCCSAHAFQPLFRSRRHS